MTTPRRVDANHAEIKSALRAAGVWVADCSAMGQGFPDLVCMYQGCVYLLEVKAQSKVTPAEVDFMISLVNPAYRIATSVAEALEIVRGST